MTARLLLLCSENAQQSDQVVVELKRKAFLWDAVLATVSLPLKFVPFATQVCVHVSNLSMSTTSDLVLD